MNGVPAITAPVPDIAFIEDLIHFPMLLHEKPESILILGGGAGGMIHELLKHPVTRIDYAELDPLLPKLVRQNSNTLNPVRTFKPESQRSLCGRPVLHTQDSGAVRCRFYRSPGSTGLAGKPPLLLGIFLLRKTEDEP